MFLDRCLEPDEEMYLIDKRESRVVTVSFNGMISWFPLQLALDRLLV